MKGESDETKEKAPSTTMSDFFRTGSVQKRREAYLVAANEAIAMQKAVILTPKKLRSESCK
jgi:ribosomal protein L21E